jgi:hypothetical protein
MTEPKVNSESTNTAGGKWLLELFRAERSGALGATQSKRRP